MKYDRRFVDYNIRELISKAPAENEPLDIVPILLYEFGDASRALVKMKLGLDGANPRFGKDGYVGELKIALGDSLMMLYEIISLAGLSIAEIEELGFFHTLERYKEFEVQKASSSDSEE